MSESSGSSSSGPGCITIIICVIIGITLYKGCESPTLYTSRDTMTQDLKSNARLHENIGCPVLAKEQPNPEKIRKANPDDNTTRVRCDLCSSGNAQKD